MGIALGLLSSVCFGSATILVRIGMRTSPRDDGLYVTILVNAITLGVVGLFMTKPEWSAKGVLLLAGAGLIGTVGGRHVNLRAIRMIGPTRASTFITGSPAVAAFFGWIILDETLGPIDAVGGTLVIAGLLWLTASRSRAAPVQGAEAHAGSLVKGYVYAMATPVLFGLAFVTRKWGLEFFDSAVLGAFIGAAAALVFLTAGDTVRGGPARRFPGGLAAANRWFIGAGAAISLGLITQFTAYSFAPAWVVGALLSTQVLWVTVMGYLFLRSEEHIDRVVVASMLLVGAGVALISVAV